MRRLLRAPLLLPCAALALSSPFSFSPLQRRQCGSPLLLSCQERVAEASLGLLSAQGESGAASLEPHHQHQQQQQTSGGSLVSAAAKLSAEEREKPTLWQYVALEWKHWAAAICSAVGNAVVSLMIPRAIGSLIESLTSGSVQLADFSPIAGLLVAKAVLSFIFQTELRVAGNRLACALQNALFSKLLSLDISFYDDVSTGELLATINSDVELVKLTAVRTVNHGVQSLTTLIGGLVGLYMVSPLLTGLLVSVAPVWMGVGALSGQMLRRELKEIRREEARIQGDAGEVLSNLQTVRFFSTEYQEAKRYEEALRAVNERYDRMGLLVGAFLALGSITMSGMVAGVLLAGSRWDDALTAGKLTSFLMIGARVQYAFGDLTYMSGEMQRAAASSDRVMELLSRVPSINIEGGQTLGHHQVRGDVEWKNVTFAYPSRPESLVFRNLSLKVPSGATVALVGPSGSGKSSLARLLLRFYEPLLGSVEVDGIPIQQLDPRALRSVIGIVPQRPVLWRGTIASNIRYGKTDATEEEVREAARQANALEFIERFPDGFDTRLGEGGAQLSGGQMQRIAIARALLRNPRILILDEATSALDSKSEVLVQEALDKASRGRTVIVIAHRLSTVRGADTIVVLKDGSIVESGSHDQLMRNTHGLYYEMMQQAEGGSRD